MAMPGKKRKQREEGCAAWTSDDHLRADKVNAELEYNLNKAAQLCSEQDTLDASGDHSTRIKDIRAERLKLAEQCRVLVGPLKGMWMTHCKDCGMDMRNTELPEESWFERYRVFKGRDSVGKDECSCFCGYCGGGRRHQQKIYHSMLTCGGCGS